MSLATRSMRRLTPVLLTAALSFAGMARASVVMNATRYVYHAGARELTVKVSNAGSLPALTQAWIDGGEADASPEHVDVPFNLTPPIARLEPGKSQTLRVSWTGEALPADRESRFWLNVLEVPPKPADGTSGNAMQLAFRYRLKLFYRPSGLPGSAAAAPGALSWSIDPDGRLLVRNDSAFHVALNEVTLLKGDISTSAEPFALAPYSSHHPAVGIGLAAGERIEVRYQSINDYGGFVAHRKTIDAR